MQIHRKYGIVASTGSATEEVDSAIEKVKTELVESEVKVVSTGSTTEENGA